MSRINNIKFNMSNVADLFRLIHNEKKITTQPASAQSHHGCQGDRLGAGAKVSHKTYVDAWVWWNPINFQGNWFPQLGAHVGGLYEGKWIVCDPRKPSIDPWRLLRYQLTDQSGSDHSDPGWRRRRHLWQVSRTTRLKNDGTLNL